MGTSRTGRWVKVYILKHYMGRVPWGIHADSPGWQWFAWAFFISCFSIPRQRASLLQAACGPPPQNALTYGVYTDWINPPQAPLNGVSKARTWNVFWHQLSPPGSASTTLLLVSRNSLGHLQCIHPPPAIASPHTQLEMKSALWEQIWNTL